MEGRQTLSRLGPLTSLRFFAAAMIVIGHSHNLLGSMGLATTFSLAQGVSFFFVLSGFILAYNYPFLTNRSSAVNFLVARFARIWPLHMATLLIWLAIITPSITHEFSAPKNAVFNLVLNVFLLQSWSFLAPHVLSFNGVAWSISTEAFFYAAFAIIALCPKKRLPIALGAAALSVTIFVTAATLYGLSAKDDSPGITMFGLLYTNPLVRVLEFLFGVICARVYLSRRDFLQSLPAAGWLIAEIVSLTIVGAALYVVASPSAVGEIAGAGAAYYAFKEGMWVAWGLLILTFAWSKGPIARILSMRPMIFLGEISFALYLVHVIVLHLAGKIPVFLQTMGWVGAALYWFACITSAATLHISIENPFRKLIIGRWHGKPPSEPKPSFRKAQYIGLALLFVASIFVAMYEPSTAEGIDPKTAEADPYAFAVPENRYTTGIALTHVRIATQGSDKVEIGLYFKLLSDTPLDRHVGIHLNDKSGKLLHVVGDLVIDRASRSHQQGFAWLNKVTVDKKDFDSAKSIGIATFKDVNRLDTVVYGPSDWDSKRLVIPIPSK